MDEAVLRAKVRSAVVRGEPWPDAGPILNACNELPYVISCLSLERTGRHLLMNPDAWREAGYTVDFHLSFKGPKVDREFGWGPMAAAYFPN